MDGLNTYRGGPDERGHFGIYGGRYVAETLMPLILEVERAYDEARADPAFVELYDDYLKNYVGRPSPRWTDQRARAAGYPDRKALTKEMRMGMERTGLCMGCHREMTNAELWAKVAQPGQLNDEQHIELMNKMLKAYSEAAKK